MIIKPSFRGFNILHKTVEVNGLDIFYLEAGSKNAFSILLLHGFPTSSHMFRNLIPALSDKFHLVVSHVSKLDSGAVRQVSPGSAGFSGFRQ